MSLSLENSLAKLVLVYVAVAAPFVYVALTEDFPLWNLVVAVLSPFLIVGSIILVLGVAGAWLLTIVGIGSNDRLVDLACTVIVIFVLISVVMFVLV